MRIEPRIDAFDIAASGLMAQRLRMEVIANNIANVETTFAQVQEEVVGGERHLRYTPYRRQNVVFAQGMAQRGTSHLGVQVLDIVEDPSGFREVQEPEHEHAVKNPKAPDFGTVYYPNVNHIVEFADMIAATRIYGANLTVLEQLKAMGEATHRILG